MSAGKKGSVSRCWGGGLYAAWYVKAKSTSRCRVGGGRAEKREDKGDECVFGHTVLRVRCPEAEV